ncbi:CRAL-TRIO domain-containing protein [Xylariales sp. PMI_506]|nr:CRAL-TRIO domain-containing protein [Xylariales sp. PMI_506]
MATVIPEGHVGNLTLGQERKLQEAWERLAQICGMKKPQANGSPASATTDIVAANGTEYSNHASGEDQEHSTDGSAADMRKTLWDAVKCDNPDSLLLRFLRARKWDIEKAIEMLVSDLEWRHELQIESTIVKSGEAVALKKTLTEDEEGFMLQYRSGKSYVRGLDKQRRPVYIVKPRLHKPSTQTEKAMENYILHTIESIHVLVRDPFDTACLIFDMTGFGLRNMDFPAVRFIISVFESRYPETLGLVLIHNAPYVFSGIWRVVKAWLDPVIASKINFTRSTADMEEFISKENLQAEYGGKDDWTYSYVEPQAGENDCFQEEEKKAPIEAERAKIIDEYEAATISWAALELESDAATEMAAKRAELAERLRVNYWQIDPFVRSRSFYDRTGILDREGVVNFSPKH